MGALASLIMAIVPAHLMRSVGGGYDNESIAMTAMCATFYFWCRSVRGISPYSMSWLFGVRSFFFCCSCFCCFVCCLFVCCCLFCLFVVCFVCLLFVGANYFFSLSFSFLSPFFLHSLSFVFSVHHRS